MNLYLQKTDTFAVVNGARARAWVGKTGGGIPVTAYVTCIQVEKDQDLAQFERELTEIQVEAPAQAEQLDRAAQGVELTPERLALLERTAEAAATFRPRLSEMVPGGSHA